MWKTITDFIKRVVIESSLLTGALVVVIVSFLIIAL